MGYELNKLMRQFGVSTPGAANYSGTAAPVAPLEPTKDSSATGSGLRPVRRLVGEAEYEDAMAQYRKDLAAYEANKGPQQAAYEADRAAYDKYRTAYMDRVMNTPQYLDAQYRTTNAAPVAAPTTVQDLYRTYLGREPEAAGAAGWTRQFADPQAYLAANPDVAADPYFSKNPLAHYDQFGRAEGRKLTPVIGQQQRQQFFRAALPEMRSSSLPTFGRNIYDTTGSYHGDLLSNPSYSGYTPIVPVMPGSVDKVPVAQDPTVREAAHGGAVHDLVQKYQVGGAVRKFRLGGAEGEPDEAMPMPAVAGRPPEALPMPAVTGRQVTPAAPVTASPAARPVTPPPATTTPVSPAANDLMGMLNKYLGAESTYGPELVAARKAAADESKAFSDMIANAMRGQSSAPDKTEMYFRLAAAFGAPTRTGHFAENLGMVGKELGEYAKDVRASKKADRQLQLQLGLEAQKLKAQGARDELTTLRTLAGEEMKDKRAIVQEYLKSGRPQSEAGKAAIDAGLTQGTPEFTSFVNKYLDDKIRSGNIIKEAMVAIAAGNLAVSQSRETRAAESSKKLTPAEVKLKSEAEEALGGLDDSISSLKRAYSINPNTFDGTLAAMAQQKVLEQTNPKDPRVLATREQANLLSKGAIDKLRASFGGNPTEGERSALLALEGIDSKSKEERATIMRNTYKLLQARRAREQKRLNDITAGLYRDTTPAAGDLE